jgi:hypothetical protein
MLDRVLFNPENRLLGASTGDLSLYGGQTDPSMAIREARNDTPALRDGGSPAAVGDTSGQSGNPASPSGEIPATPYLESSGEGSSSGPASFLISSPATSFQPHAPMQADGSPIPSVTTWHAPQPTDQSAAVLEAAGAGAPTPSLDTGAGAEFIPATETAIQPIQLADGFVQTVLTEVANTSAAIELASGVIDSGLSDVAAAAPVAGELLGDLVTAPAALATNTLDHLASAPAPLTGAVSPILDTAMDAAGTVLNTGTDTVSAIVTAATETLDGLDGADPAGGVATLVSLVSVSDMFDLNPVGAPTVEDAADPGFGMLDTLAADDLLPDALLGGNHDDHGGLLDHTADPDHPLGL